MNEPDDGLAPDEQLASLLCEYDEKLAAGESPELPIDQKLSPEQLERLQKGKEGIDLLNLLWPRQVPTRPATNDVNLPSSGLPAVQTAPATGMTRSQDSGDRTWDWDGTGSAVAAEAGLAATSIRLPGFAILEEVGRGGMGIVYRAMQISLNREVAVKVLPPQFVDDQNRLRRFLNEAQVAARLTDSVILPIHDVLEIEGVPVLVMPFVDGADLGRIIAHRRAALRGDSDGEGNRHAWASLTESEFLDRMLPVLDRVVDAVAAVHQAGIIHRDVKPSNVLVDLRGNVWLTDFGLARLGDESTLTATGAQVGSPGFMSPEQWDGKVDIDARADVFGLGATIYQALTLRHPYGTTKIDAKSRLAGNPKILRRSLRSYDAELVVLKALEIDRRDRYESAGVMRDDWRCVRMGLQPKVRRAGIRRRVVRRFRQHRWGVSDVIIGVILAALVALAWRGPRTVLVPPPAPGPMTRTVMLTTQPPGARVVLVPLDGTTGDFLPEKAVRPGRGRRTPVILTGVPVGDYLVVAEAPRGAFHEVLRHVPGPDDTPKGELSATRTTENGLFRHYSWTERGDGMIVLPPVVIPPAPKESEMSPVSGDPAFILGDDRMGLPAHPVRVDPFSLDRMEVTIGSYVGTAGGLPQGLNEEKARLNPKAPVVFVTWHQAVAYAEKVGKRLPTEEEYEFVATAGGASRFPWGNEPERYTDGSIKPWRYPEVGRADDPDRTPTPSPLIGLYSSVAEWTASWPKPYPQTAIKVPKRKSYDDNRVVRGGPAPVLNQRDLTSREWALLGSRVRLEEPRDARHPGLGFRCARSVKPRFLDPE